uniref:Histidine--tRNA ligase n=1 Tax=uncultured bacterium contig00033 TaxID=1181522 RepID=A0A806K0C6_9BACT|nr:histidyl-tRNA synthetase [uncultured bacterium contig00033]
MLKGFRDFLPPLEITRLGLLEKIENSFRLFGFAPIDTPALEYAEILLGKGGGETEKQIYRFKDNGGRDVALRFDLTVPFARFMAEHRDALALPFKRYHIAKVWRGENTQRGRYREFMQCDFDIVGSDSVASDFEILLVMKDTLMSLGAGNIIIRVNHRGLFNRFLDRIGIAEKSAEILRVIDKVSKIGAEKTSEELSALLGNGKAVQLLDFITLRENFDETLKAMTEASGPCPEAERLSLIRRFMIETGTESFFALDPSIARGLDYYTGLVFESFLAEMPGIGSVCSGGRYDNLVGLYTKPNAGQNLSGIGASIGIDRLIAALEALGKLRERSTYSKAVIACVKNEDGGRSQALAETLRKENIPCEVSFDEGKLTKQFINAEKKAYAGS